MRGVKWAGAQNQTVGGGNIQLYAYHRREIKKREMRMIKTKNEVKEESEKR